MAAPRSSPPPASLRSASNSESSSTSPILHSSPPPPPPPDSSQHKEDHAVDCGTLDELHKNPDSVNIFEQFESEEDIKKYQKYEADYACRLMSKYFKKNIYGGDTFDLKVAIDNDTIKASRWHVVRSHADPLQSCSEEQNGSGSTSAVETAGAVSNGKPQLKKSS
ncbi:hypothetical protein Nepgr_018936 [Nepenthes gracilis]|uniref:Uncharacterized protein n=1 Tax=Nepenthes gracilis TaxID=150966 RepID=A0AAD3SUB1_NEPGR|nr:hypothetical protein Nepgr_018936 [Nepenthes gracilis]